MKIKTGDIVSVWANSNCLYIELSDGQVLRHLTPYSCHEAAIRAANDMDKGDPEWPIDINYGWKAVDTHTVPIRPAGKGWTTVEGILLNTSRLHYDEDGGRYLLAFRPNGSELRLYVDDQTI